MKIFFLVWTTVGLVWSSFEAVGDFQGVVVRWIALAMASGLLMTEAPNVINKERARRGLRQIELDNVIGHGLTRRPGPDALLSREILPSIRILTWTTLITWIGPWIFLLGVVALASLFSALA